MKRIILKAKSSVSNGQSEYSIGLRLIKMLYNIFNDTRNINLTMSHYKGENVESLARVDMHYSTLWIRDNYGIFVDQRDLEERGWKTLSLSFPLPQVPTWRKRDEKRISTRVAHRIFHRNRPIRRMVTYEIPEGWYLRRSRGNDGDNCYKGENKKKEK